MKNQRPINSIITDVIRDANKKAQLTEIQRRYNKALCHRRRVTLADSEKKKDNRQPMEANKQALCEDFALRIVQGNPNITPAAAARKAVELADALESEISNWDMEQYEKKRAVAKRQAEPEPEVQPPKSMHA
jgi:hypothetical protein